MSRIDIKTIRIPILNYIITKLDIFIAIFLDKRSIIIDYFFLKLLCKLRFFFQFLLKSDAKNQWKLRESPFMDESGDSFIPIKRRSESSNLPHMYYRLSERKSDIVGVAERIPDGPHEIEP